MLARVTRAVAVAGILAVVGCASIDRAYYTVTDAMEGAFTSHHPTAAVRTPRSPAPPPSPWGPVSTAKTMPATLPEPELERRLKDADAAVVIKLGRHLPKVRGTLARIGRLERAIYVERGSTAAAVMMRLADKGDDAAPYFAIVLVPGWEERA